MISQCLNDRARELQVEGVRGWVTSDGTCLIGIDKTVLFSIFIDIVSFTFKGLFNSNIEHITEIYMNIFLNIKYVDL